MSEQPPEPMFEPDDCWRTTDAMWAWIQRQTWAYGEGTPYIPKRSDVYWEGRDAIVADEGWAYRRYA